MLQNADEFLIWILTPRAEERREYLIYNTRQI